MITYPCSENHYVLNCPFVNSTIIVAILLPKKKTRDKCAYITYLHIYSILKLIREKEKNFIFKISKWKTVKQAFSLKGRVLFNPEFYTYTMKYESKIKRFSKDEEKNQRRIKRGGRGE